LISKEINDAKHEYINIATPPIIEFATPLMRYNLIIVNKYTMAIDCATM
jgi:hypothetical protein